MTTPLIEITDPDRDRYATLRLIPWWRQEILSAARVMVVGAGALGNEVLKNLALLGVGHVLVVDMDTVQVSNLSRSVLFRQEDAGRPKADVAAQRMREINPDVQVVAQRVDVTRDLGLGVYRRMDLVFGCLDNRAARLAVNRACWRAGKPWIDGALDVLMGMVRVFVPPDGACYECSMTDEDYKLLNVRYACPQIPPERLVVGQLPTTPTSASIIAALQVQEALKICHGMEVAKGAGIYFNGQKLQMGVLYYQPRHDCPSHDTYPVVTPLEVGCDDSVGQLLDAAARHAGCELALLPDREVLRAFICPQCGRNEPVYRPYDQALADLVRCPACGADRVPDVALRLSGRTVAGIPLRRIGIPPLHVVRMQPVNGPRQSLFFELTKDRDLLPNGWVV